MSVTPFASASGGFANVSSFPDIPPNSAAMRAQMEVPSSELGNYINSTLLGGGNTVGADFAYSGSMLAGGWTLITQTLTYATADSPTFTVTTSADLTPFISVGMKIMLTNTTAKYFIVTAITSSTITLYGGTDYTLTNAAISGVYYSNAKAPFGFPLDPLKWSVILTDATSRSQSTGLSAGAWLNVGSLQYTVPIGAWKLTFSVCLTITSNTATTIIGDVSLSTSASNGDASFAGKIAGYSNSIQISGSVYKEKLVNLASKTIYYLNAMYETGAVTGLYYSNGQENMILRAICDYL